MLLKVTHELFNIASSTYFCLHQNALLIFEVMFTTENAMLIYLIQLDTLEALTRPLQLSDSYKPEPLFTSRSQQCNIILNVYMRALKDIGISLYCSVMISFCNTFFSINLTTHPFMYLILYDSISWIAIYELYTTKLYQCFVGLPMHLLYLLVWFYSQF